MRKTAIIGTGMTGLSIGAHLSNATITFFDKSRKPGGRMSTRTTRTNPELIFDHGVHIVDPSKPQNTNLIDFAKKLNCCKQINMNYIDNLSSPLKEKKVVVGNQIMESIPNKIHQFIKAQTFFNTRINEIIKQQKQYFLKSEEGKNFGPYSQIFVAIPFPQCLAMKQDIIKFNENQPINYYCIWTIMLSTENNLFNSKDVQYVSNIGADIEKGVNQNFKHQIESKYNRWVFNMSQKWSQQNKDLKPEEIQKLFIQLLGKQLKEQITAAYVKAHRWLYARPNNTAKQWIKNEDESVVFCGDWVGGGVYVGQAWNQGIEIAKLSKL